MIYGKKESLVSTRQGARMAGRFSLSREWKLTLGPWSQVQSRIQRSEISDTGSFDVQTNMGSLFDSDTARLLHARLRRLQSATSTAPGRWVGRVASHRLARGKSRGRAWKWQRLEPWPLKR
ncbi:uncharacterized protein BO87DRAFT_79914 [Aspergillus neoniger CBS 115656]|uniref:Uncharacterized protein n=1 Tax=Aspergillus neoniger (strain CBS 115656) TaxID=1448310 RepID=A0A318ZG80_ASPNB|nr:hypothetical protein BO87DRAFT_79914 [Aspergillus neoniger CBS 115656]PYH39278.1 hypothetical protein BO87DRAFT_79914 [Aspergillus neoniger CBS 115656]